MGYKKVSRTFNIIFDKPDDVLNGLEIKARAVKFGKAIDLTELGLMSGNRIPTAEDKAILERGVERLFQSMYEWNMTDDDGAPIPCTAEEFNDLDFGQSVDIINAWSDIILGNVTEKKELNSNTGPPSEVGLIPMEPLSQSQTISETQS